MMWSWLASYQLVVGGLAKETRADNPPTRLGQSASSAPWGCHRLSASQSTFEPDPLAKDFDEQYPGVRCGDGDGQDEGERDPMQPPASLSQQGDAGDGVDDYQQ
jgi:hypothetical protein